MHTKSKLTFEIQGIPNINKSQGPSDEVQLKSFFLVNTQLIPIVAKIFTNDIAAWDYSYQQLKKVLYLQQSHIDSRYDIALEPHLLHKSLLTNPPVWIALIE